MAAQKSAGGVSLQDLLGDMSVRLSTGLDSTVPVPVADLEVRGIQLDSRKIQPGDLFLAVPGFDQSRPSDGRQFIAEAIAAGAVAVLAEQNDWPMNVRDAYPVPVLLIEGLSAHISAFAGRFYGQPSKYMQVTGFTGTNGKTTCSHLFAQVFNHLSVKTGVLGTLGYGVPNVDSGRVLVELSGSSDDVDKPEISRAGENNTGLTETGLTTPDAVVSQAILAELRGRDVTCVAMEVSSHSLDQGRVNGLDISGAVFTNLSREHLDYHGSMESYLAAKQKLFEMPGLKFAVINIDDPAGMMLVDSLSSDIQCYTYSLSDASRAGPAASVYASKIRSSLRGIDADIVTPWGEARLNSRLIGDFNLSNILAVIAAACASGQAFQKVMTAVTHLSPVSGRLEMIDTGAGPCVVIDYAHTPDALEKTLKVLTGVQAQFDADEQVQSSLWCVFGCGGDRDKSKRAAMGVIANELADEVVVTSDNPRTELPVVIMDEILAGVDSASPGIHRIEDRAKAIEFAVSHAQPEDTVLIAGKGHEDYQIIGDTCLPFSDAAHARLALRAREDGRD